MKFKNIHLLAGSLVAGITLTTNTLPSQAKMWDFNYQLPVTFCDPAILCGDGDLVTAVGTFTTTEQKDSNGYYTVTDIGGERTVPIYGIPAIDTITALIPPGGYQGNDNLFSDVGQQLTANGFAFKISSNVNGGGPEGNLVRVFSANITSTGNALNNVPTSAPATESTINSGVNVGVGTLKVTPTGGSVVVPEPLTILGGMTALGLGAGLKRRIGKKSKP